MKHKLESGLLGEISITSDMQMTPTLMAESEEELKSLLMKVKRRVKTPSQGHRDPDSLRAALSLRGEAPAWECSLGASFPSERALPAGGFGSVHTPSP